MAIMGNVWTSINSKRPRGKKLYKVLGIISGLIWFLAIGSVFAFKDKKVSKAIITKIHPGKKMDAEKEKNKDGKEDLFSASVTTEENEVKTEAENKAEDKEKDKEKSDLPSQTEYDALKQVAELQVAAGQNEKAVAPLKRILTIPTKDAELLTMATTVFLGVGRFEDALQTALQAIALAPENIELKVQVIEATYRLNKVERAFEMAKAALKDHPTDLGLLVQAATMEIDQGKEFPDYGKSLTTALKLDPDYLPTIYLQGRKASLEGNYGVAAITFKKLLKQDPKNAKAHGQLGMALYHLGKESEAQFEYESELAINPEDYNTWFNVGELELQNANHGSDPAKITAFRAQALKCFLKALELNPDHAEAHYRVGVILNGNGQYKEAIKHLEAAHKIDETHVPTLLQLSLAYEYLKRLERAKEYLNKAYELDPLNKVVLFKLKQLS